MATERAASLTAALEAQVGDGAPPQVHPAPPVHPTPQVHPAPQVRPAPGATSPPATPTTAGAPETDAQLHTLLARVADGLLVMDESNLITYLSDGLTDLLGSRADIVGHDATDLIHPDDAPGVRAALASVLSRRDGATTFEFRAECADGAWRWLEARAANLLADPSVAGIAMNVRDVSERKSIENDLRHRALHDTLTGLPNRTLLDDRLRGAIGRSGRDARTVTVFFLDLDAFKSINDTLGHAAGDEVLAGVGRRLAAAARAQDPVARYGGDEFVIVVEHEQDDDWVRDFAERLRSVLREPVQAGRELVPVSASVGVASASGGNPNPEGLLRDADAAMYHVKQAGGDAYAMFDDSMVDEEFVDLTTE